jgi:hypothetical protein
MTATDLYEIVRDVPREAWPVKTEMIGRLWHCDTLPVPLANIISMFVGSMTAELLSRFDVVETVQRVDGIFMVKTSAGTFKGKSLVAALAAACKEVGGV